MSVSMRARVCAPTPDLPLITLETVGTDTPARSAMNAMVTVPYGSPPATWCARPGRPTDPLPGTGKAGLPSMPHRRRRHTPTNHDHILRYLNIIDQSRTPVRAKLSYGGLPARSASYAFMIFGARPSGLPRSLPSIGRNHLLEVV